MRARLRTYYTDWQRKYTQLHNTFKTFSTLKFMRRKVEVYCISIVTAKYIMKSIENKTNKGFAAPRWHIKTQPHSVSSSAYKNLISFHRMFCEYCFT